MTRERHKEIPLGQDLITRRELRSTQGEGVPDWESPCGRDEETAVVDPTVSVTRLHIGGLCRLRVSKVSEEPTLI